ncbi:MAG: GNAT family N-acetyltransferase [Acidobacteria bacterium]|nr:GNAT family N-acetyltransferase [Acidobacteriota bacterium]
MRNFSVSKGEYDDIEAITALYRRVAAVAGGLARAVDEIHDDYVDNFVWKSLKTGVIVVARDLKTKKIIGEIHAYALGPRVFEHVLGELTIAVDPDYQSIGVGKAIFTELMREIREERSDILRVELIARESNAKAIAFYEKLGFEREGRMTNRIRSVGGGFEADIPMAWHRPPVGESF